MTRAVTPARPSLARAPRRLTILAILLVLVSSAMVCGCWDRIELDQISIVMGVAIDAAPGTEVKVTAQIAVPGKASSDMSGAASGGGGKLPMLIESGTGLNAADAIEHGMYPTSTHRVYLAHAAVGVIGLEIAKRGINPIMDQLLRHQEFRENMWILVAQSDAETVIKTPVDHQMIPARGLESIVENEVRVGNTRALQLHTLAEEMMDKTRSTTTALVSVETIDGKPRLRVAGTAVIKGDKVIGELDMQATRGLMWALGEVKGGVVTVTCKCGGECAIFLNSAAGKITGKLKDGRPVISIDVKMTGTADALACSEDLTQPGTIEYIEEQVERLIESEVGQALQRAIEMDADIFGFGGIVHASYRTDWKPIEDSWSAIFPQSEVNVKVDARVQYLSLLSRPFHGVTK